MDAVSLPRCRLSIVLKVSLLSAAVAAMASLVVGSLVISGYSEIMYKDALNHLKYETNIKAVELVSEIKSLREDVQYLVGTPPVKGIPRAIKNGGVDPLDQSDLSTWKNRLETIFSVLVRAKPNYIQIRYIGLDDGGKELVRINKEGDVIRTVIDNELQKKGHAEYFKDAIKVKSGEIYLSRISLNKEHGKITKPHMPVIRAASPVYFNNKMYGIVVINMRLDNIFRRFIENTPKELMPYVINKDGYFLSHPDRSMTFGFDLKNENKIQDIYKSFDIMNSEDVRNKEFSVATNGEVLYVVKVRYDSLQKENYLSVMLSTKSKDLQSESIALKNKSVVIMLILVVISFFIATVLTSKVLNQLRLVSKASRELARGSKINDIPVFSNDEIGEVAKSFNFMRRELEDKEHELVISQGRAHHANKLASLGEIASGIAHEVNSPIQAINLIAQRVQRLLKKNISSDEIDSSMENISNNVSKVSGIIDSLRNVSRDSTEDQFISVSVRDIISDAINLTEERFKINNVKFEVNFVNLSENNLIQCQRLQISQVLINLINNSYDAIKDLENKWITINIRKLKDKIEIAIEDSGTEFNKELKNKIFEPMFTTKDIGKGTGLGLSISREIVTKHNGQLYIDDKCENTRFILEIPFMHEVNNI